MGMKEFGIGVEGGRRLTFDDDVDFHDFRHD